MRFQKNIRLDDSNIRRTLYLLFAFSGFSGLIYESIWTHYLKLFLGCAAYAQTLVLVIFMGGMALGAWGVGRSSAKIRNLLAGYALVEGLIGVMAVVFHGLFIKATDFSYFTIIPKLTSPVFLALYKWGLAALLILPQTVLLGATFPLMSAGLIRLFPERSGRTLAFLYFSNSIGAVAGVLVSGYILIGLVGLPGTILAAGLINLFIALVVWLIYHNEDRGRVPISYQEQRKTVLSRKVLVGFLWCSCLTGTASFMYEIGWIRMLSLVLGSSTHAFELMLSAFILGLALGGYWIKKRIDGLSNPIRTLGIVQVVMGGFALSTLMLYGQTFHIMEYVLASLSRTRQAYFFFNLFSQGLSILVMLPATVCAGMTLPIITYYLISRGYGEGAIGKTYAANTMGAIVGVILGIQLIMPVLGMKNVIVAGAAIDVLLGLVLLWHADPPKLVRKSWGVVAGLFFVFFIYNIFLVKLDTSKMASGIYRTGKPKIEGKVLFHKDGRTASVDLVRFPLNKDLSIMTNGKPDASIGDGDRISVDEPTQILSGALAWGMHDRAKTAAVIGMGSGMTSHVLLSVSDLESVDIVEIEPAMVEGARGFGGRVSNTFNDPRSRITIEDAKTFFTNHHKKYDLIVSEPSNPWVSGVSGLFSREFYRLIRNYLNESGLLVQWLQLYEISTPLVASVMKSLSESFEGYEVYFSTNGDLLILAGRTVQPRKPSEKMFEMPGLKADLARIGIGSIQDLRLRYLGDKRMLDPLFQSYEISPNSDYFPILDLNAVRDRFMATSALEVIRIRTATIPLTEVLKIEPVPIESFALSQADYIEAGQNGRQAMAIYQYFENLKGKPRTNSNLMNGNSIQIVRNIRSIHDSRRPDELTNEWLRSLHSLAHATLPYLPPKQMVVIWNDVRSARWFASLPDSAVNWVKLYEALSYRDFKKALQYSTILMPVGIIKATPENNYLLLVTMLSNVALQNYKGAVDAFNRYENQATPPIEIRLLKAIADSKGDK
jgi:predicted membrane-bound spermidine synthase